MKLTCTQENLTRAVGIVARSVGKDASLPVLSNVLLATERGRLKLASTNLELGVTCFVGARVEKEGSLTVPARLLLDYVSNLPSNSVLLEVSGDTLNLECGENHASIKGIPASEFPLIPGTQENPNVVIEGERLAQAIGQVVFAAAKDESRPEIAGVYVQIMDDGEVRMAATDSYRLAERRFKNGVRLTGSPTAAIIPGKALSELHRILGSGAGEVSMAFQDGQVIFSFEDPTLTGGNVEVVSRVVEGRYPDYAQIIPESYLTKVKLNQKEFSTALKATSLFSRADASDLHLAVQEKDQAVSFSAESGQLGKNDSVIPGEVEGGDQKIVFNHRYLLDGLSACGTDEISLCLNSDAAPGALLPTGDASEGYTYIIMPIKS